MNDLALTYEEEKELGIRKESGAKKLKELKKKHKDIIAMHLAGWSGVNIANALNMTQPYVSLVLNDPLAQDIIKAAHSQVDLEFNALYAKVIETLRDGLNEEKYSLTQRLQTVDRYAKMKQVAGDGGKTSETAEDVIKRLLEHPLTVNIQSNGGTVQVLPQNKQTED